MHHIIFDLEWNQPADETAAIQDPVHLTGEIIQIGAVKLGEDFRPVDELRLYITPKFYPKMHKRITALTGIRDRDLAEQGVPFPEAYHRFLQWCGDQYTFMTWSMSDLPILLDNMIIHGIDISGLPGWCDLQRIFSREIMRGQTRYSLDTALTLLKEQGDTAHDALHDARNTARICQYLQLDQYLGEYTARVFADPPTGTRYSSRQQLLQDPTLSAAHCPWCGAALECSPWLPLEGNTYIACGICPEEDEFLLQVSAIFHQRGAYSARRTIFEMSDDLWDIYMDKKEALGV